MVPLDPKPQKDQDKTLSDPIEATNKEKKDEMSSTSSRMLGKLFSVDKKKPRI
jgi:hypothetical protein